MHPATRSIDRPAEANPCRRHENYLIDPRELSFFLWEHFDVEERFLGRAPFEKMDRAAVESMLGRAQAFAAKLAACYREADRAGARLEPDGSVVVPRMFGPLWEEFRRDWRWTRNTAPGGTGLDGQGPFPLVVTQVASEMLVGANPAFIQYAGFSPSAVRLIERHGSERQKRLMLERLRSEEWDACFCATEEQAGSDMTAVDTVGTPLDGEVYAICGEKRFITAGMHSLTENTIYAVIARIAGSGRSSFSLSCFLVPRFWIEPDGRLTANHVECAGVDDKMGFNGCANTHLVFGARGVTRGFLLGNRPNVALLQLAELMRAARISTGLHGVGIASSAYLHSVRYARARVQGRRFDEASNPAAPRVAIVEHHDVQRMLLEMKAKVEGCRALIGKLTDHATSIQQLQCRDPVDAAAIDRHMKRIQLYTPIVKAYVSDEAWRIATLAMQVHGAVGYLRDRPLEQYLRDIKVLSIWEGTNYMQAQDLVRDKLAFGRQSLLMRYFAEDLRRFLARRGEFPRLAAEFERVSDTFAALIAALEAIKGLAGGGRVAVVSQFCTRFLEMFAEIVLGWVLLEAACVAERALHRLADGDADRAFYNGKIKAARFFIHNILPGVEQKAAILASADRSFVAMDETEFGFRDDVDLAASVLAGGAEVDRGKRMSVGSANG
jgi:acyl-CoA dehydrogenase